MKIPDFRAAARWFDLAEGTSGIPVEPADPGRIHAFLMRPIENEHWGNTYEWILKQPGTALMEHGAAEAACGMSVRVVYRMSFDTNEPEACRRCIDMTEVWQTNPQEYERRVAERHERWEEREAARYEASYQADLVRQYSYDHKPHDGAEP